MCTIGSENRGLKVGKLIHSTPTNSMSTGERFYEGKLSGKTVLVYHTEGAPANKSTTNIYQIDNIKNRFSWDWDNVPSFSPVKKWVKQNS